jgi:hypothetical protein
MSPAIFQIIELAVMGYAACGLAYSAYFYSRVIKTIDSAAKTGSLSFHLVIFPGLVALWPFFAFQYEAQNTDRSMARLHRRQNKLFLFISIIALASLGLAVFARANRFDERPSGVSLDKLARRPQKSELER